MTDQPKKRGRPRKKVEVTPSSGNVFADLNLPYPEELLAEAAARAEGLAPTPTPVPEVVGLSVPAVEQKIPIHKLPPKERFAALSALKKPKERFEPSELPTWVLHMAVKREGEGMTRKQAAKFFKRHESSIRAWQTSPAYKKYSAHLREAIADPVKAAEEVLQAKALGLAYDNIMGMNLALESGLIAEYNKQARYLLDRAAPPPKKNEDVTPVQVVINYQGTTLSADIPMGESSAEKVVDAEIVDE